MKDYIKIGIDKVLFSLNEDRSRITYVYQKKERNVVKCVRKSAMLYFVGFTGQQCVSSSDLKNFDLAFPPKEKQKEIAPMSMNCACEPIPYKKKANACLKK